MLVNATAGGTLTIPSQFNGPPDIGQGGYVCGRLSAFIAGPAQVVLRRPAPLGIEMQVSRLEDRIELKHGDETIATATPARIKVRPTNVPTWQEAEAASLDYGGFTEHLFPTCFVCGPARQAGDGLRIFPGHVANQDLVSAPWTPREDVADVNGLVRPEIVWAALDCPTGWALSLRPPSDKVIVLGTFAAAIHSRPHVGGRYVLTGWPLQCEGRKFLAAAALQSEDGELNAVAEATWIQISVERRQA